MDIKFIKEEHPRKADSQELNDIIDLIHKNNKEEKDSKVGERFIRAVFLGYKTLHEKEEENLRQKAISSEKIQRLIKPIAHQAIRQNIPEFKQQQKLPELKVPLPLSIPEVSLENSYTLLISDKKVLARAEITKEQNKYNYNLIEPKIDLNMLKIVKNYLINKYKKNKNVLKNDKLILKTIKWACSKTKTEFNENIIDDVKYYLYRDFVNFSKIDPLLHDLNIKSIICEGINKPIYIDYQNERMETNIVFNTTEELNFIVYKFAEKTNERISEINPILNARYNEFRIQANLGLGVVSSRFVIKREINF